MTDTVRVVLLRPWKAFPAGKDLSLGGSLASDLVARGFAAYEGVAPLNKSIATPQNRKAVRKK